MSRGTYDAAPCRPPLRNVLRHVSMAIADPHRAYLHMYITFDTIDHGRHCIGSKDLMRRTRPQRRGNMTPYCPQESGDLKNTATMSGMSGCRAKVHFVSKARHGANQKVDGGGHVKAQMQCAWSKTRPFVIAGFVAMHGKPTGHWYVNIYKVT